MQALLCEPPTMTVDAWLTAAYSDRLRIFVNIMNDTQKHMYNTNHELGLPRQLGRGGGGHSGAGGARHQWWRRQR
jgi:uncharacterized membrane protein YgcG